MLLWSGTVYLLEGRQTLALCLAVGAHELGHVLALLLMGFEIRRLELRPFGLQIIYGGVCSGNKEMLSAAAGPAAGLLFALLMCLWEAEFAALCAGLSILLSAFNLLPVPPLDGGRISSILLRRVFGWGRGAAVQKAVSCGITGLLLGYGIYALCTGMGAGLVIAWLTLTLAALREENTIKI